MDPMTRGMERFWEWEAKQARDALTPQERVELDQQGEEFVRRVRAELEARQRAEACGESTPDSAQEIE